MGTSADSVSHQGIKGLPQQVLGLAGIDCRGLLAIYEALRTASDQIYEVAAQPRCFPPEEENGYRGGPAFSTLERLAEWLLCQADDVVAAAKAIRPKDDGQDYARSELLIKHELNCGSAIDDVLMMVAGMAAAKH